jgi:hypothetical protein
MINSEQLPIQPISGSPRSSVESFCSLSMLRPGVPTRPELSASSGGRCNTCLKFTRRSLKSQGLSWTLIQAQRALANGRGRISCAGRKRSAALAVWWALYAYFVMCWPVDSAFTVNGRVDSSFLTLLSFLPRVVVFFVLLLAINSPFYASMKYFLKVLS